jgi:hypothetical protein
MKLPRVEPRVIHSIHDFKEPATMLAHRRQTFGFTHLEMKDTNLWRLMQWWAREELNFRPHAYQACALTT